MKLLFATLGSIAVLALGASSRAADVEGDAWAAAMAQKAKSQRLEGPASASAFIETAAAFERFAAEYPQSERAPESLAEAGVCWFAVGRNRQVLHRNPVDAAQAFETALGYFETVIGSAGASPAAARAQYMRGSTQLFLGDLEQAEAEYTRAIENHRSDPKYFGKSLERRAAVRRHLLRNELAIADMRQYQKEAPQGSEDANVVVRQLELSQLIPKDAPALDVEAWVQGEPVELASLKGEVVALYFFATWCPNCAREREFINDLYQRYSASGFRMIGITDHSENQTVTSVRAKLASAPLAFPVMMDGGKTLPGFKVSKFPDMALIDRQGRVRWRDNPGALADWTVEALLTEAPAEPSRAPQSD